MTISDNNILVHELKLFNYVLPRGKKRWNFPPNFTPSSFSLDCIKSCEGSHHPYQKLIQFWQGLFFYPTGAESPCGRGFLREFRGIVWFGRCLFEQKIRRRGLKSLSAPVYFTPPLRISPNCSNNFA